MAQVHEVQYLSDKEVDEFVKELDHNGDGHINYEEVERTLDKVHAEIAPKPKPFNLHHHSRDNTARHEFLRSMLGNKDKIPVAEFREIVKTWKIQSLEQDKRVEEESKEYRRRKKWIAKLRAWWAVRGPTVAFLAIVVAMQLAFGIWQLVKYLTEIEYRQAFGWGVVLAKTCAGALYPTLFFLILSMSRLLSTFARQSYYISRFINWDLSQSFHMKISIVALALATLHAIGHLTGSMLYGSRPAQQDNVAALLGPDAVPRPYRRYIASLPGWTGIVALAMFYTIALLSMPQVRKGHYEIFQLGHLLMFPMIGLLCAHGTLELLQWTMLGYFLAFPTLLVILERLHRLAVSFHKIPAKLHILDEETVCVTATIPDRRFWKYEAGQYAFLQVPQLSFWQWHPFTISTCEGNKMQLHIKTDGDWTMRLRDVVKENGDKITHIGIDGPFGAPAQRFYDFDHSIIMGSGIGVTPFSGILADLQDREERWEDEREAQKEAKRAAKEEYRQEQRRGSNASSSSSSSASSSSTAEKMEKYRRVDFHWIVKDRNSLLWFSDLLNEITEARSHDRLDIRITTHVTMKRKNISTHVYRCLLEKHRTEKHPASPLTGLLNPTHFGRPDLGAILEEHYQSLLASKKEVEKVGVFFCGAPPIGMELAERCHELTVRGRQDGSGIEYHFMMEVFG